MPIGNMLSVTNYRNVLMDTSTKLKAKTRNNIHTNNKIVIVVIIRVITVV